MDSLAEFRKTAGRLKQEVDTLRATARNNMFDRTELCRVESELRIKLAQTRALKVQLAVLYPVAAEELVPNGTRSHDTDDAYPIGAPRRCLGTGGR